MLRLRKTKNTTKKRKQRRADAFGESAGLRIRHEKDVGWFRAPRTLPILLQLLREKEIVGKLACDQVYVELLARDFGDGFIETKDEKEHAFLSGYRSERAERTWRERVDKLVELGFVDSKERYGHKHGHLLLVDPQVAVLRLQKKHARDPDLAPLFDAYHTRRREIGAADALRPAVRDGIFAEVALVTLGALFTFEASKEAVDAMEGVEVEDAGSCTLLWKIAINELRPVLDGQDEDQVRRYLDVLFDTVRKRIPREPKEDTWATIEKLTGRDLSDDESSED